MDIPLLNYPIFGNNSKIRDGIIFFCAFLNKEEYAEADLFNWTIL